MFSNSLPVHIRLVTCYGSERKITDCSHKISESNDETSLDARVMCEFPDTSTSHHHGESIAGLVIVILLAVAVVILGVGGFFFVKTKIMKKMKKITIM